MSVINRMIGILEGRSPSVKKYDPKPGEVCATGTWMQDSYKPSAYRGRLAFVNDNGHSGVRMLDRDVPVDLVGEWVDLQLLPDQRGVRITRVDGVKEIYTSDKNFVDAVVKSYADNKGIMK